MRADTAEPPEIFIAEALRPATGADPPAHLVLVESDLPALPHAPEGTPTHVLSQEAPLSREKTRAPAAHPLPDGADRPAWSTA
jgi:hypothetical protein